MLIPEVKVKARVKYDDIFKETAFDLVASRGVGATMHDKGIYQYIDGFSRGMACMGCATRGTKGRKSTEFILIGPAKCGRFKGTPGDVCVLCIKWMMQP